MQPEVTQAVRDWLANAQEDEVHEAIDQSRNLVGFVLARIPGEAHPQAS